MEHQFKDFIGTVDSLRSKLGWIYDNSMQDWPLEIAESIDVKKCINLYGSLDDDEKFVVMEGILYAMNEMKFNTLIIVNRLQL